MARAQKRKPIEEQKINGDFQAVLHDKGITLVCLKCGTGLLFANSCSLEAVTANLARHRIARCLTVQANVLTPGREAL
jgi:hypothetical protein